MKFSLVPAIMAITIRFVQSAQDTCNPIDKSSPDALTRLARASLPKETLHSKILWKLLRNFEKFLKKPQDSHGQLEDQTEDTKLDFLEMAWLRYQEAIAAFQDRPHERYRARREAIESKYEFTGKSRKSRFPGSEPPYIISFINEIHKCIEIRSDFRYGLIGFSQCFNEQNDEICGKSGNRLCVPIRCENPNGVVWKICCECEECDYVHDVTWEDVVTSNLKTAMEGILGKKNLATWLRGYEDCVPQTGCEAEGDPIEGAEKTNTCTQQETSPSDEGSFEAPPLPPAFHEPQDLGPKPGFGELVPCVERSAAAKNDFFRNVPYGKSNMPPATKYTM